MVVRVNDRGPYVAGRMLDVSERVAKLLAFNGGMARVRLDFLGMAGPPAPAISARCWRACTPAPSRAIAKAKPATTASRSPSAALRRLASPTPRKAAPAAAALDAAVRPVAPATTPDAAGRRGAARRQRAPARGRAGGRASTAQRAATLSPFGQLVVAPFKPLVEAAK